MCVSFQHRALLLLLLLLMIYLIIKCAVILFPSQLDKLSIIYFSKRHVAFKLVVLLGL